MGKLWMDDEGEWEETMIVGIGGEGARRGCMKASRGSDGRERVGREGKVGVLTSASSSSSSSESACALDLELMIEKVGAEGDGVDGENVGDVALSVSEE